jgi:hypothetical protein
MTRTIKSLPFVKDRVKWRSFWNVKPTGDYEKDCIIGTRLALKYLAYEEADYDGPGSLQLIVKDMPRKLSGVEIGFLTMVSYAARSRRISGERSGRLLGSLPRRGEWTQVNAIGEATAANGDQVNFRGRDGLRFVPPYVTNVTPNVFPRCHTSSQLLGVPRLEKTNRNCFGSGWGSFKLSSAPSVDRFTRLQRCCAASNRIQASCVRVRLGLRRLSVFLGMAPRLYDTEIKRNKAASLILQFYGC